MVIENNEASINLQLGCNNKNKNVYKKVWFYCVNLGLVYLFDYIIISTLEYVVSIVA